MAFNETKNMKVCGIILLKSGPVSRSRRGATLTSITRQSVHLA